MGSFSRGERFARGLLLWSAFFVGAASFAGCGKGEEGPGPDPAGDSCESAVDCGPTEYCTDEGVCASAGACGGDSKWSTCANLVDGAEPGMGSRYACVEQACTRQCVVDTDCSGENEVCSDYGSCIPFLGNVEEFVATDGTPSALRAGVAEELIDYPIGVSLGGYGSRAAVDDGRWAQGLTASQGQFGAQFVRALWLENDENTLILVRAPIIFPSGFIHERVVRKLQEELGVDLRDELVVVGTHTHSGPGRHWRLPSKALLDLGVLGTGGFLQAAEDWLVDAIANAVLSAHASLAPAKAGWKIVEAYDLDDVVARDRWSGTPHFDMNRLLLIRVDRADDTPLAAVISYGSHGTDNSSDYATDDVVGGAERGLSAALSEEWGHFIPTLYMPEGGGSMSHASGTQGHSFPHSTGRAGAVMVEKALAAFNAIEPKSSIGFRSRTYRFPITYDLIGYEPGEFGNSGVRPLGGEFTLGGILCAESKDDTDYATFVPIEDLGCISLASLLYNRRPTLLMRGAMTAIEFDGLTAVTLPGEPAQEVTWQVLERLRDDFGLPTASSWVFGYAQTHLLYMTSTNLRGAGPDVPGYTDPAPDTYPDNAFSFLQGGYEPSMTPWGPRSGDFFVARAADAFRWLSTGEAPSIPPILPHEYTRWDQEPVQVDSASAADVGNIVTDVPATVKWFELGELVWEGGDPGAERPQAPLVVLERYDADSDTWAPHVAPNYRTYTNREPWIASRVQVDGAPRYLWTAYYDLRPQDVPVGRYRFQITGHYLDASTNERTEYTAQSAEFNVSPLVVSRFVQVAADAGSSVSVELQYPVMQRLEIDADGERGKLRGNLQLFNSATPSGFAPSPVCGEDFAPASCVTVSPTPDAEVGIETLYESVGGRSGVPVTRATFTRTAAGTPSSHLYPLMDVYGNTWEITVDYL